MCLGTYVAAMADGGYIVSYTDDIDAYSKENVATITESESSSSTLQKVINGRNAVIVAQLAILQNVFKFFCSHALMIE